MKQSFICPCFNEEKNVIAFAKAVLDAFPNTKDYELVFINDGSRDNTIGSLKKLKKESTQNIKIINFSRNFGKESAMYAGLQNCKGDYITIIDTDLQQSPEIVKEMVDILENDDDIDCICACQENRHESSFAKFCKKTFTSLPTSLQKRTLLTVQAISEHFAAGLRTLFFQWENIIASARAFSVG